MRFERATIALICAIACTATAARAADVDSATQKSFAAQYALSCTAALDPSDANLDAAFATLTPDYVNVDPLGSRHTRDEIVGQLRQQMKSMHGTSCDNTFASITQTDPTTIVVFNTMHLTGNVQAPDGTHQLDLTDKAQDTWKNVGGAWRESESKDLRLLVKIDGSIVQDEGS